MGFIHTDGEDLAVKDTADTQTMTGAEAIVASLEALGVTDVFGMPGGAILPTYDPLMASTSLRHILVRHEQGAGHAAEGYAIATGKVGCAIVTSGPGATNILTALADANMDSIPMVVISGQVGASLIGTDAFQEADIVGASMPLTKHAFLVTDAQEIPARLAEAFHLAGTGRPGPVLVDVTKSAQTGTLEFAWPPALDLPGYRIGAKPHKKQVKAAARALIEAQAPVFYVGGGMIRSGATQDLKTLVELTNAPVVTTLTARGAFPDSDSHNLGMPGMHGTVAAVGALQRADLIVALGSRFDDRVTGKLDSFAPRARVVHIDIDAAEISKNRFADIPIVGDLKTALGALNEEVAVLKAQQGAADLSGWWRYLDRLRERYPMGWAPAEDGKLVPQEVLAHLSNKVGSDAIYVTGVGQHQMWAAQFIEHNNPRHFISSSGLGTMGYCVPAAMGAQVGQPNKVVWAIDGDGSFQMTNQELATCTVNNIPIKVALINNGVLGMVRQWQSLFYGQRYSNTTLNTSDGDDQIPNFVKLAEAYGMAARTVRTLDEVDEAIDWAMSINDRPVLIDFRVSKDAMVWPMVAAGVSNDEIRYAQGMAPNWEVED
ncbi:acetolactate synthase large subunit [Schaalia sp. ZJ405]|uniref:acetolactate synthase large subunit n=1 Tax=unclassified Schaalia TaxID=2691889 RepID=UPI0013EA0322|nr:MULTISPECIES: acetolactate synthase large subunit [unclassified Schaalia]QPK81818.1 acetolactate synthase large subunit [Schaalia sp. ZJ405]